MSYKEGARIHAGRALVRAEHEVQLPRGIIAGPRALLSYAVASPRAVHRCKARVQDKPPARLQKRSVLCIRGFSGSCLPAGLTGGAGNDGVETAL
jgi:hypothetical protein